MPYIKGISFDEWLWQHEFLYSNKDIGTYPIDIELLVDRTPTPDGTRGEWKHSMI